MTDPTHQPETPNTPGAPGLPGDADTGPIRPLCELDGQALDALLAARVEGLERGPVPAGLGERRDKLEALLGLLEQDVPEGPDADLTARTLLAVKTHEQRQRFSAQVQMLAEPRRTIGVGWQQLATSAAVFIIGASLLMPVMERQQADSRRVAGAGYLNQAGQAMNSYAADNQGQMPRGHVKPGMPWTEVGMANTGSNPDHSNSAHLYRLVTNDYIKAAELICPENAYAERNDPKAGQRDWSGPRAVSFSYQNQYAINVPRLDEAPGMAVLADRNPLFTVNQDDRIVFDTLIPLNAPSHAHHGAGQNVLTANGVVAWRIRPTVEIFGQSQPDNIWAASGIDVYTGKETPANPFDAFLVP